MDHGSRFKPSPCSLAAVLCLFAALSARADSQSTILGNLLIFYTEGSSGRILNVVPMEDRAPLKIIGRAPIALHKAIHAQFPFGNQIILLLWDQVEVYSLAEPSAPQRVASYRLRSQHAAKSGDPRIERTDHRRFLIISPVGAAELSVDPEGKRWTLVDTEMTPELQEKAQTSSPVAESARLALVCDRDTGRPRLLKESARFRYETVWARRTKPGLIIHTEYLRKVDKASGKTAAQLLLGGEQETID
ncbi:MAG TPA: hypothetical protein VGZ73_31985 [Bryobacteraceae bacterium]|jgi:hypothetical protein|nr:hypothetical protein [Bryobacteraceae bacterium]